MTLVSENKQKLPAHEWEKNVYHFQINFDRRNLCYIVLWISPRICIYFFIFYHNHRYNFSDLNTSLKKEKNKDKKAPASKKKKKKKIPASPRSKNSSDVRYFTFANGLGKQQQRNKYLNNKFAFLVETVIKVTKEIRLKRCFNQRVENVDT